jgi:hypothetical protein
MNLEKAIEINQAHAKVHDLNVDQGYFRALNLGIEALKRIRVLHEDDALLPGETPSGQTEE